MKQKKLLVAGAALVAIVGTLFIYKKKIKKARIPQTPLNNPGDQSEFTTAPSASDLG